MKAENALSRGNFGCQLAEHSPNGPATFAGRDTRCSMNLTTQHT